MFRIIVSLFAALVFISPVVVIAETCTARTSRACLMEKHYRDALSSAWAKWQLAKERSEKENTTLDPKYKQNFDALFNDLLTQGEIALIPSGSRVVVVEKDGWLIQEIRVKIMGERTTCWLLFGLDGFACD